MPVTKNLYYFVCILRGTTDNNMAVGKHMEYFLSFLTIIKQLKVEFYLISNDSVSATFLARFIANKFKQNLGIKTVLNPLKREFKRVVRENAFSPALNSKIAQKGNLLQEKSFATKQIWKKIFSFCSNGYEDYLCEYYKRFNTWFSLDTIMIVSWLNKNYSDIDDSVNICMNFLAKLNGFFYSYMSKLGRWVINVSKFIVTDTTEGLNSWKYTFEGYKGWNKSFDFILWNILINRSCFIRDGNFVSYDSKRLQTTYFNHNRFLKYTYWHINYKHILSVNETFNYLKVRAVVDNPYGISNYLGFKIHCLGRFSRRQRASSYWFAMGSVPLNKFRANIDYGNYIVPIKNSAISIKVWVYLARPLQYMMM